MCIFQQKKKLRIFISNTFYPAKHEAEVEFIYILMYLNMTMTIIIIIITFFAGINPIGMKT